MTTAVPDLSRDLSRDFSRDGAARLVGAMFLFALVTAVFNQFFVQAGLVVAGDPAVTAQNVHASEPLFRVGIVSELLAVSGAVVLSVALYVLLSPVHTSLALLALAFRVTECAALGLSSICSLVALRLLSGTYASAFPAEQLHGLAGLFVVARGSGYLIALTFFGFGSALYAYLFLRSGYLPRALAAFGIFASISALVGSLGAMLSPGLASMGYFAPIFLFELVAGGLLLARGAEGRSAPIDADGAAAPSADSSISRQVESRS